MGSAIFRVLLKFIITAPVAFALAFVPVALWVRYVPWPLWLIDWLYDMSSWCGKFVAPATRRYVRG